MKPTNHFEVWFFDVMANAPSMRVTVLNVPTPAEYARVNGVHGLNIPLAYLPDQEAVARHIVVGQLIDLAQDTPTYGIHATRLYLDQPERSYEPQGSK